MREDIKTTIKKIMREEKITQEDLANAFHCPQCEVSRTLRTDIKLSKLLMILHALDCELIIRYKNHDFRY